VSSLLSGPASPAVRKPAFELAFGSGSADDWARALAEVSVEAGLAPAVDAASVVLAARSDAPSAALADTGQVSLGFEDDATVGVFKGAVRAVNRTVSGKTRIVASNGGAVLASFRLDQGYEQQSAGAVVRDLAGKAAVDTGSIDDGPSLPYYVVDSRRSAWEHVARLAALAGFEAWVDAGNALHFGPFQAGSPAQTFTFGQDILELDALESPSTAGAVTVVGDGAAGSNGSDAWSWNLKDASPLKGTAGTGDPALLVQLGALRSADAASAAAQAIVDKAKLGGFTARLLVPGAPKVGVGATVAIASAPDDTLNGSWLVRVTRHKLVKARGYTTLLLLAKGDT
jgi:phage protein D